MGGYGRRFDPPATRRLGSGSPGRSPHASFAVGEERLGRERCREWSPLALSPSLAARGYQQVGHPQQQHQPLRVLGLWLSVSSPSCSSSLVRVCSGLYHLPLSRGCFPARAVDTRLVLCHQCRDLHSRQRHPESDILGVSFFVIGPWPLVNRDRWAWALAAPLVRLDRAGPRCGWQGVSGTSGICWAAARTRRGAPILSHRRNCERAWW